MTATLYARISSDNHKWLTELAADSGLSLTKLTDLIISEARQHEWVVRGPRLAKREASES